MKKLEFTIDIKAPRESIWKVLWDDKTYRQWTSAFSEGSYAVTDWKEGSKIHFLDGKGDGMYSIVETSIPNEFMSFKHIGEIKDGVEQPIDNMKENWYGAMENYKLIQNGVNTKLEVSLNMIEEYSDYFNETFPKALSNVKRIAESQV